MEESGLWLWEPEEFVLVVDAVGFVGEDGGDGGEEGEREGEEWEWKAHFGESW